MTFKVRNRVQFLGPQRIDCVPVGAFGVVTELLPASASDGGDRVRVNWRGYGESLHTVRNVKKV